MKKIIFIILIFVMFAGLGAYAVELPLVDMRNKIFRECRDIEPLLKNSKDIIVVNSMWSSGIMAVSQLDAYFSMVGIFNTIKDKELADDPTFYLIKWLNEIKNVNVLNIKSLNGITYKAAPGTITHIERLKNYFGVLNNIIDNELMRISALQKSLNIRRKNED